MSKAEPIPRASRYLRTARLALADGDPDSAANRAYYAAYSAAYDRLISDHPELDPPRTHRGLILVIRQHYVLTGRLAEDVVSKLSRLMQRREQADYLESTTDALHAAEAIESAQCVIDAFGK